MLNTKVFVNAMQVPGRVLRRRLGAQQSPPMQPQLLGRQQLHAPPLRLGCLWCPARHLPHRRHSRLRSRRERLSLHPVRPTHPSPCIKKSLLWNLLYIAVDAAHAPGLFVVPGPAHTMQAPQQAAQPSQAPVPNTNHGPWKNMSWQCWGAICKQIMIASVFPGPSLHLQRSLCTLGHEERAVLQAALQVK